MLEPEVMDSEADAREYDSMDHAAVNAVFVADLVAAIRHWSLKRPVRSGDESPKILDLGVGTAQIPVELCRRSPDLRVIAVDAAASMLAIAERNVVAAGLVDRIELVLADAKRLPFDDASFPVIVSNSILHHIAEPAVVLAEAVRAGTPDALQFHRDLCRPTDEMELQRLVATYAGDATSYQQRLFAESLHAALTLEEMQSLVEKLGFAPETVRMTSDRHWTWITG
ncbi:MAG: class I SAM-dependent methyltransferase [Pirellulales bacterium]